MRQRVSIVIPTLGRVHTVKRTIASVLEQTYDNWEIVLVDDSDSVTHNEMSRLCDLDSRIRIIRGARSGPNKARDLGVRSAAGEYVTLLDSDDLWTSERLATHLELWESLPGIGLTWDPCLERGRATQQTLATPASIGSPRTVIPSALLYAHLWIRNFIHASSGFARRRDVLALGGVPDIYPSDWALWLRIASHHDGAFVDKSLSIREMDAPSRLSNQRKLMMIHWVNENLTRLSTLQSWNANLVEPTDGRDWILIEAYRSPVALLLSRAMKRSGLFDRYSEVLPASSYPA